MKRKIWIIGSICLIVWLGLLIIPRKPKLVSSITTMETAYLTILVDQVELFQVEKLKHKLVKMCKEDTFTEIKLHTEGKSLPKRLHISVYTGGRALRAGKEAFAFTYEEGE